jgi:1,4-dihydroxy-2-naphthoate octaprenyltransferase
LPRQPAYAGHALATGLITLAIVAAVGLYFLYVRGWSLLPLGLAGMATIAVYTVWLTRNPLLCLVAPGLGFGTFMVMGTAFALTGHYTWGAFIASFVPFFLVSDLLLLNQFPDVEADASIGRRHFPIVIGRRATSWIYISFLALAYVSIVVGVALRYLAPASLLGLLTLPLAARAGLGAYRHAQDVPGLIPSMAQNVLVNIATPALTALGLLIG